MLKRKKEKLVVLNSTLPISLKDYAENASIERNCSSTSDYIRALIREDQERANGDELNQLVTLVYKYLSKALKKDSIDSNNSFEILNSKLKTVSSLFEFGYNLKENKIKRENPKIKHSALNKKLQDWIFNSSSIEVPGLIEESEERKRRLSSEGFKTYKRSNKTDHN